MHNKPTTSLHSLPHPYKHHPASYMHHVCTHTNPKISPHHTAEPTSLLGICTCHNVEPSLQVIGCFSQTEVLTIQVVLGICKLLYRHVLEEVNQLADAALMPPAQVFTTTAHVTCAFWALFGEPSFRADLADTGFSVLSGHGSNMPPQIRPQCQGCRHGGT